MNRFLSSKNTLSISILWGLVLFMITMLFIGYKKEDLTLTPLAILALAVATILWILLDTRYVIKNHFLLYRSGPFRGRIDITKIQKVQYFSGLNIPVTTKPALDNKGFIITYNNYDAIYVSPKKGTIFLDELLKINPKIEVV